MLRIFSPLENGLAVAGFVLDCVRIWVEARKEHEAQERIDTLEERVQALEKVAHRHPKTRGKS